MNYHVLTLFPEMVLEGLNTSIIGRAAAAGKISIEAVNIRDYTKEKHGHVDDAPYGGGAGMVMQAAPVCDAYEALCERLGKRPRVLYMTPQGQVFNQKIAQELAKEEDLVFLCGHYEGIDERALELIVTDYLSVGDYVLTGGELPAMVMIDCISRLVPGVLNNDASAEEESFHDNLLEYPQYTRPEEYRGMKVPEILLSGHHKKIYEWRRQQSILRTLERRPDLLREANLDKKEKKFLEELMAQRAEPVIRRACEADLDQVEAGYEELLTYEEEHGAWTAWKRGVYPTRKTAAAALAAGTLYVAEKAGEILASVIVNQVQPEEYETVPWKYPAKPEEVLVIHLLCVHPSKSGQGLGKRIVQFVLDEAKRTGCLAVRLDTGAQNRPAAGLYTRMGFQLAANGSMAIGGEIAHEGHLFFEREV